jgi:hypothetical protein
MGVARSAAKLCQDDTAVAGRLIQAFEEQLQNDRPAFDRALLAFQHARELAAAAGVNPGLVLPAALLLALESRSVSDSGTPLPRPTSETGDLSRSRELLSRARLDESTIAGIVALVDDVRHGRRRECAELQVVEDSLTLAGLTVADRPTDFHDLEGLIERKLRSEAAKARARQLFLP